MNYSVESSSPSSSGNVQQCVQRIAEEVGRVDQSNLAVAEFASDASSVASAGMQLAESTTSTFADLGTSSNEIGDVIRLIQHIADETNLLALNATIEAARAGDAGRGFAVVAAEVKTLAKQTAEATGEVSDRIAAIQNTAQRSIDAIEKIVDVIKQINGLQSDIVEEIERQDGMTQTIHAQVDEAVDQLRRVVND